MCKDTTKLGNFITVASLNHATLKDAEQIFYRALHTDPDPIHFVQKIFFGLNGILDISKEYLYNKKWKWRLLLHKMT